MIDESLTYEQKIAALTGESERDGGRIVTADEAAENATGYPFPSGLIADCWNPKLAAEITAIIAADARAKGATAMVLPPLAPATTPVSTAPCEDNYLIAAIAAAEIDGAKKSGVKPIITDFGIKKSMYTGRADYDEKAIADTFVKPLRKLKNGDYFPAVAFKPGDDENFGLGELINKTVAVPECELCTEAYCGEAVRELKKGRKLIDGDTGYVRNAYLDRLDYEKQLRRGVISEDEMREIDKKDDVIGEEAIDEAYAKSESFLAPVYGNFAVPGNADEAFTRLAEESVVMLKNDDAFPLSTQNKIAIVGNCLADGFTETLDLLGVRYERYDGYAVKSEEEISLTSADLAAIGKCSAVVYFIDNIRRKGTATELPPNRLAALDEIAALGLKTAAVVVGEAPFDTDFDDDCDGVFVARGRCRHLGDAIAKIIFGRLDPSGRLAVTLYPSAEKRYYSIRRDEALTGTKRGAFYGYKYYDGSGEKIRYPFGYGLSYGKCSLGAVKADSSQVLVKMIGGKTATTETVQVYAGGGDGEPRARKELVAFTKVKLRPRETTTVRVPIDKTAFERYSVVNKEFKAERGEYDLWTGVSSGDERKCSGIKVLGGAPAKTEIEETEVLPWKPNVIAGGYSMEEGENLMKNSKKLSLIGWVLLLATLFVDVAVVALWITNDLPIDIYETWFLLVVSALVLNHVVLLVAVAILSNVRKRNREVEKLLKKVKAEKFSNATVLKSDDAQEIFKNVNVSGEDEAAAAEREESVFDFAFDKDMKFTSIATSLRAYLSERGYLVGANEVRAILSSFASSHFLITTDKDDRKQALAATAEFLGSEPFFAAIQSDDPNAIFWNETFTGAVDYAAKNRDESVCCIFTGMTAKKCNSAFVKLLAYFSSPERGREVYYDNGYEEAKIALPPNMWVIAVLDGTAAPAAISDETLSHAEMLFPKIEEKAIEENFTAFDKIGYNQFVTMASVAKDKYAVDEEAWKRVDKLERATANYGYKLDNKDWQTMETFAAVFLACEGDPNVMTDYLVAERTVPKIAKYAEEVKKEDKSLKEIVDLALGEENVEKTLSAIKEIEAAPIDENAPAEVIGTAEQATAGGTVVTGETAPEVDER